MLKRSWTMHRLNYVAKNQISNIIDSNVDMFHTTTHLNISAGSDAAEIILVNDRRIVLRCAKLKQKSTETYCMLPCTR